VTGKCAHCGEQWWLVEKLLRKLEEANRPVYCSQSCERTARHRTPKGDPMKHGSLDPGPIVLSALVVALLAAQAPAAPHFQFAPNLPVPPRFIGKTVYVPLPGEGIDRRCTMEELSLCRAACREQSLIGYTPNPPTATLNLALANCEVRTVSTVLTLLCECEDPSRYTRVNEQTNEEAA
jgi:hypothetical protein